MKEIALTWGGLSFHGMGREKSAEVVVVKETSHHGEMEVSQKR
jgi:hypothetical protein